MRLLRVGTRVNAFWPRVALIAASQTPSRRRSRSVVQQPTVDEGVEIGQEHNALLLVGICPGHHRPSRLGGTRIHRHVRDAGRDVHEIPIMHPLVPLELIPPEHVHFPCTRKMADS